MFVRKLKNRSGSISVQIISKKNGRYIVIRTIGTSDVPAEIERLFSIGKHEVENPSDQNRLFTVDSSESRTVDAFLDGLTTTDIRSVGPELVLGKLFDHIGFDVIKGDMFRNLTIARLVRPTSKLGTVAYLEQYCGKQVSVYS